MALVAIKAYLSFLPNPKFSLFISKMLIDIVNDQDSRNKTGIQKEICTPMFTAALFTIAKTWKQPKCPLTVEWIKKMSNIHTVEYYSAIKKNEIMPFAATWMQLEIITLSEVRKRKTNTVLIPLVYESKTCHK